MNTRDFLGLLLLCCLAINTAAQTPVNVMPLSELANYPERFAPATVISINEPMLSAQITAQIVEMPVRVGDMVSAGDVLAKLECTEYVLGRQSAEASLESTQALYELAQKNLERTQSLVADQLVSVENLDSNQTELDSLSASLKAARASLDLNALFESRCEIISPFDALVLERTANVGQLAVPGTVIANILDLDSLEISAQVFASDADQFDMPLELWLEANDKLYPIELDYLVGALNSATRNREARLVFTDEIALPGSSGKIIWNDPRPHLPANYFVERSGKLGFFSMTNNTAEFHPLDAAQPGRMNPVDAPLDLQIVTEGHSGLSDGDSLIIKAAE